MVQHHLLKLESQHILNEHQSLNFKYGGQLNNRQEFDVRRSGRSDSPALSLFQWDHFIESMYRQQFGEFLQMKIGAQFRFTDNTNNPETGILPLLPDYRAYRGAAFAILQRDKNKLLYEIGARYDLSYMQYTIIRFKQKD
jgi:iron complex outermembrane receptor protein